MAGVVLDTLAASGFLNHLDVVEGPLPEPMGFEHLQLRQPLLQLRQDRGDGALQLLFGDDVVSGWVDIEVLHLLSPFAGLPVDLVDPIHLVSEQFDSHDIVVVSGDEIDCIPLNPEPTRSQLEVISLVLDRDEPLQDLPSGYPVADLQLKSHLEEILGISEAVDAGDRRHHDDVLPGHKGCRRRETHLLDLGVDGGVLLDVLVFRRDVGLGLVVVVVRDEVLDPVLREELLELIVELGCQCLVVGYDQRWFLDGVDDLGYGVGLARSGDAQEGLKPLPRLKATHELSDRLGLGALRLEVGGEAKLGLLEGIGNLA